MFAAMILAGCNKETPTKRVGDDSPIIISESGGKPMGAPPAGPLQMAEAGPFNALRNNGAGGKGVTQMYPRGTFTSVDVVVNGQTATYCIDGKECKVDIKYEDSSSPTLSVHFVPASQHPLTLDVKKPAFELWTGYAASANQIFDPEAATAIKGITVNGQDTGCNVNVPCQVTVHVQ